MIASGIAIDRPMATGSVVAICSRPAPIEAAVPARSAAPAVVVEPAITRTVPRVFLSPCSSSGKTILAGEPHPGGRPIPG